MKTFSRGLTSCFCLYPLQRYPILLRSICGRISWCSKVLILLLQNLLLKKFIWICLGLIRKCQIHYLHLEFLSLLLSVLPGVVKVLLNFESCLVFDFAEIRLELGLPWRFK